MAWGFNQFAMGGIMVRAWQNDETGHVAGIGLVFAWMLFLGWVALRTVVWGQGWHRGEAALPKREGTEEATVVMMPRARKMGGVRARGGEGEVTRLAA